VEFRQRTLDRYLGVDADVPSCQFLADLCRRHVFVSLSKENQTVAIALAQFRYIFGWVGKYGYQNRPAPAFVNDRIRTGRPAGPKQVRQARKRMFIDGRSCSVGIRGLIWHGIPAQRVSVD
jgi:hypothetical protein